MQDRQRRPQSPGYRILACLCYLPPVAIAILLQKQYQSIRLLRFHAVQSLTLFVATLALCVLVGFVSSILGNIPFVGMGILMMTGLGISALMVGGVSVATYAAIVAYDGRLTRLPIVNRQVRQLEKAFEQRFVTTPPKENT